MPSERFNQCKHMAMNDVILDIGFAYIDDDEMTVAYNMWVEAGMPSPKYLTFILDPNPKVNTHIFLLKEVESWMENSLLSLL